MDAESGVLSNSGTETLFWRAGVPHQLLLLCISLLLSSKRLQYQAVRLERIFKRCLVFLLQELGRLMPFHSQGDSSTGLESLRRRVSSMERLVRTSVEADRVQRGAEPAVGFPVVNTNRLELSGSYIAGLWCGCIVSLLALCIGVYIGHSLCKARSAWP